MFQRTGTIEGRPCLSLMDTPKPGVGRIPELCLRTDWASLWPSVWFHPIILTSRGFNLRRAEKSPRLNRLTPAVADRVGSLRGSPAASHRGSLLGSTAVGAQHPLPGMLRHA